METNETNEMKERVMAAVNTVREFLSEMGLEPVAQTFEQGVAFRVGFDEGPATQGIAQVRVATERFAFYFLFEGNVPAERRLEVCEYLTRANWGIIDGNFELDMDDGSVRYKVAFDFSTVGLQAVQVRNAILSGMDYVEIFADGLSDVSEGRVSARVANAGARAAIAARSSEESE